MEEDFSQLLQGQEKEIEFVFSHDEIQDSVAKLFQTHTRFSIPVSQLVTSLPTGGSRLSPKLSRTILSALKSTPHGLKTITDPNDPNKTGLLADYAIAALDSVIDTLWT
jgi:hypothetical protein